MTKQSVIPTPIINSMKDGYAVDNSLIESMDQLKLMGIFSVLKINRRKAINNLSEIVYALLILPLLQVENIWCFTGKFIGDYIKGGKDVLYDFLSRQNINWSLIQLHLALRFCKMHTNQDSEYTAFVVDDTIKRRRGKAIQAMSSHYDHTEGHSVMGQQVLQLGLTGQKGFLPLLSQIFVGSKKVVGKEKKFKDKVVQSLKATT